MPSSLRAFDHLEAVLQVADLGRELFVAGACLFVLGALRIEPRLQFEHTRHPAAAQPQRRLHQGYEHNQGDGDSAHAVSRGW